MKTIVKSTLITVFATALCAGTTFAAKGTGGTKPKPIDPVEAYLKQNDKNKDGFIDRKEAHMGEESFAKWDKNKDGRLDKEELKAMLHVPDKKTSEKKPK